MKKLTAIEPEEITKMEESTRPQHTFNPITSIIGIVVILCFILAILKVVYSVFQTFFY